VYGIVYVLFNEVNGKSYVGQTVNTLKTRWKGHCKPSQASRSHGIISQAVQKHGKNNFMVQTVCQARDKDDLDSLEKLWVWALRSSERKFGYNRTAGGDGSLTQEARDLMRKPHPSTSEKLRGLKRPQHVKDVLTANRRFAHSPEANQKRRIAMTGRKHTPETVSKMATARTLFWRRKRNDGSIVGS
jgi:group I intron endonuclease